MPDNPSFLTAGGVAEADPLSLTLASPFQTTSGGLLSFEATVTNTDPITEEYLNSDSFTPDRSKSWRVYSIPLACVVNSTAITPQPACSLPSSATLVGKRRELERG